MGFRGTLPAGAVVRIMQSLGSGYTVATDRGYMYRVEAKDKDMDALGAFQRGDGTSTYCGSPKCHPPRVASILFSPKREL